MTDRSSRKAILLAGGAGTRLHPATLAVSKQLLPIYDKPMIYYPLSTIMLAGIRDVLVISTPRDTPMLESLLGDGERLGMAFSYAVQPRPEGIAQALIIAERFLDGAGPMLVLGDNIFYGHGLREELQFGTRRATGATIYAYQVEDPERYGVVTFDERNVATEIVEKPKTPSSPFAVTGLYFYDERAVAIAKELVPSARGELEITDVNRAYLAEGSLHVRELGRGFTWLDAGTHDAFLDASNFVATLERRQGLKIACLEEIAWRNGWIDDAALEREAAWIRNTPTASYLRQLLHPRAQARGRAPAP